MNYSIWHTTNDRKHEIAVLKDGTVEITSMDNIHPTFDNIDDAIHILEEMTEWLKQQVKTV